MAKVGIEVGLVVLVFGTGAIAGIIAIAKGCEVL